MNNLIEFYLSLKTKYKDKPAFASKLHGSKQFQTKSYAELIDLSLAFSEGISFLNVGDRVGFFADNSFEWMVTSIGITFAGCVDVPRASDVTEQDIEFILNHSEAKLVVVENTNLALRVLNLQSKLNHLKYILILDGDLPKQSSKLEILLYKNIIETGQKKLNISNSNIQNIINQVSPNDLFTLIYTSGTTGTPKGVMLTHANLLSQIERTPVTLSTQDCAISILPIWHIFERTFELFSMANGVCTYYTNIRSLKEDLAIVKPTFMASAPRLWESIYGGILGNISKSPRTKQVMFEIATTLGKIQFQTTQILFGNDLRLDNLSIWIRLYSLFTAFCLWAFTYLPYLLFDALVLSKIRNATGGRLRGSVSGGGALPFHIDEFFNSIGIPVLEGYGMTETSPVIAVRSFSSLVAGTVGPLYIDTSLRLVDIKTGEVFLDTEIGKIVYGKKGEIHVKGPQVMAGYYKNPEATNKVLKDGWMNTGDLGLMTANDCLKIVGRTKETIVLLGGENVEPVPIEAKLLESEWIDQIMVVGQDRKFLSALVVPNQILVQNLDVDLSQGKNINKLKEKIQQEIKSKINADTGFKSFERVVDVSILTKPFEVGDELTAKLSLKRHVILEKYQDLIENIYKGK
ncbi:MAG: long-chain fatty acid--CoA ligase [Leptospira sp.]|nr:long-chain fatty acid--CoA ligase [Leptospira sp.]